MRHRTPGRPEHSLDAARLLTCLGLLLTAVGAPGPAVAQPSGTQAARPNVVYILLDDVGYSDLGAYGGEIRTPNIDQLAAAGLRYTYFDTRAICSPTRAALLTGRNNQTVGMIDLAGSGREGPETPAHSRGFVTPAAAMVPKILAMHGYSTSGVGKWHLTPATQMPDSASTRENWPVGKGFQRWYGWLTGWTDQYDPSREGVGGEIKEDDRRSTAPRGPDYHVSVAMVDRAIDYLKADFAASPRKPSFLYVAPGAAHAPIQVPKRYIDKYVPVYEKGWDRIREERFERQKRMGLIPASAVLPARNEGDPAWESLSADERKVYARFMATYAGFLEHADEQVGRLVAYLKASGQYDNTLIFVMSDNGAAPEAGVRGSFLRPYGDSTSLETRLARIDELGSASTQPLYQRPWAMAGVSPFKMYKLWPYAGGVRDPLIVSWPGRIRDPGAVRTQHVDVTDITPTVLDILGVQAPKVVDGVPQMEMAGRSILRTIRDPRAPSPHPRQFYVMRGNRYILDGDWKAIAIHTNGTSFDEDRWELYDVAHDWTESRNVADQHPAKLRELQALWQSEAAKYGALPLVEFRFGGSSRRPAPAGGT
jgi:arylsulfatase A-like enzyme